MAEPAQNGVPAAPARKEIPASVRAGRLTATRFLVLTASVVGWLVLYGLAGLLFPFITWVYHYPVLFSVGIVLVLSIYNLLGQSFGVWRLFLHQRLWPRFLSAFGATVVAGQLMAATFFVEPRFHKQPDLTIVDNDAIYCRVAGLLRGFLGTLGVREHDESTKILLAENHQPGDHNGGRNELKFHLGRRNTNRPDPTPEDFAWRWLTFVLVTSAPIWFTLALPALPIRAFEGLRFTPPAADKAAKGKPAAELIAGPDGFFSFTPGWWQRLAVWLLGMATGVAFLALLIWFGIPETYVLVWAVSQPFAQSFLEHSTAWGGLDARVWSGIALFVALWLVVVVAWAFIKRPAAHVHRVLSRIAAPPVFLAGIVVLVAFVACQVAADPTRLPGIGRLAHLGSSYKGKLTGAQAGQVYACAQFVFLSVGLLVFLLPRAFEDSVSPGLAISALLWLIIHISTLYHMIHASPVLELALTIILVTLLAISNSRSYKLKIPGLESVKPSRRALRKYVEEERRIAHGGGWRKAAGHEPLLERWRSRFPADAGCADSGPKPKLAVVCVSGGALRSALWTGVVLDALRKKIDGFDRHVRLITGASGGMLGAAAYVSRLHRASVPGGPGFPIENAQLVEELGRLDSLSPVACRIALYDPVSLLDPLDQTNDRGRVLEESWADILPQTFSELAEKENEGLIPSIVFAPMFVEDGRRLLISNLDLGFLTKIPGPILVDGDAFAKYGPYLSQEALELRTLFDEQFPGFRLRTAVRLNASFPYVSPAVSLPTDPPRRPVDAGYYDNYGVNIACLWLHKHRRWLLENTSGVALIQIRDHMGQLDRFDFTDETGFLGKLTRTVSFLTAPLAGANKARSSTTSYRNDEQIWTLDSLFNRTRPGFFANVIFEFQNDGEVALNWQLSNDEVDRLKAGMGPNEAKNDHRLEKLCQWWQQTPEDAETPVAEPPPGDALPATAGPSSDGLAADAAAPDSGRSRRPDGG